MPFWKWAKVRPLVEKEEEEEEKKREECKGETFEAPLEMGVAMIYKTNYAVHATQWKEILSTAYVWFDWASMPQVITSSSDILSVEEKEKLKRDNRNAVYENFFDFFGGPLINTNNNRSNN